MSDTVTKALQTALAPQTGMRRIPLSLETYQHQSPALSSKLLLNMFAEQSRPTRGLPRRCCPRLGW